MTSPPTFRARQTQTEDILSAEERSSILEALVQPQGSFKLNYKQIMTYLFKRQINHEDFMEMVAFVEANTFSTIYFSSEGGDIEMIPVYLDFFNRYGSTIDLVGFGDLFSSGFEVFFMAKTVGKRLLPHVCGMYHMGTIDVNLNERGLPSNGFEATKLNNNKTCGRVMTNRVLRALPFLPGEKKALLNGQDVYFDNKRMHQLLIK